MIRIDALFQGRSIAAQQSTAPALSLPNAKPSLSGNSTKDLDFNRFMQLDIWILVLGCLLILRWTLIEIVLYFWIVSSVFMQVDIFGSW